MLKMHQGHDIQQTGPVTLAPTADDHQLAAFTAILYTLMPSLQNLERERCARGQEQNKYDLS